MKIAGALLIVALGVFVGGACKRDDATIGKEKSPSKKGEKPEKHREKTEPCVSKDSSSGNQPFGAKADTPDAPPCKTGADCKDQKNGRCFNGKCAFDGCYADKDCGKGVCECSNYGGHHCRAGDCAVDSDCGGSYCSPTYGFQCGAYEGVVGYYCHTSDDECTNDDECKKDKQQGYCAYDVKKKHWRCGYGHCVG
jgi:hypothetical protein